jgi:hypothetical protein
MKNFSFKSIIPHLVAILIFACITMAYLSPLLNGKQLKQSDITQFQGMSKEIADYRTETGKEALWTNRMFGGMPAYQISVIYSANLVKYIDKIFTLGLPHPAGLVFLYFIGFYILLLVMRVDYRLSIVGAIAFAFSSFFFIIIDVGHNTQAHAIGYIAPVIAGMILTFRGKYLLGGILTALFLSLELFCNHVQITYYMLLTIAILVIFELVKVIKEKEYKPFIRSLIVLAGVALIAVGTSFTNLWATYEYGKYTTRGKSELTFDKENQTSGLDRDYATDWSYGKMETFTLIIPNYMGGSSSGDLSENSDTYKALLENNVPAKSAEKVIKGLPLYWGPQDTTSGPVYVGAIIAFLFILGLFIVKGRYKWWLLTATLLSIFLAWGKNMMWFTNLFFDYVPGYDKFRSVTMTLVIAELCMPLLALLGLKEIFNPEIPRADKMKALKYSGIISLGILVVFGFFSGSYFDFVGSSDASMTSAGYPDWLITAIQSDRHNLVMADTFRSLAYIVLAFGFIILFVLNKIKNAGIIIAVLGILVLADMWTIDKRYLKDENFVTKSKMKSTFTKSKADEYILTDTAKYYRVLNLANPFNDAMTSYYHNSLGGYHGAKLKRYQELIQFRLSEEITDIKTAFSAKSPDSALYVTLKNLPVINMLNTKYLIYSDDYAPLVNADNALGNAWFVNDYKLVANADSEIIALKSFDPVSTAIVDKRFEDYVSKLKLSKDSAATITLTSYSPNDLKYSSTSAAEGLAIFSEIYYDKGWDAYIDGKKSDYIRANYILRAMTIPAGTHTIEWKFEPQVFYTGEKVSLAFNILLIIGVIGGLILEIRNRGKEKKAAKQD